MPGKKVENAYSFPSPEPVSRSRRILPIFIPFSGCPRRCVFCAQDIQTGKDAGRGVLAALAEAEARLQKHVEHRSPPLELAFYGGTFTALDADALRACIDFALRWQEQGMADGWRCSTRPDAVNPGILDRLKAAGCRTVELGIQSFSGKALSHARRGYGKEEARRACALVREAGLELGVQLMPGMPGLDAELARDDVREAVSFAPAYARLYPCLVLEGTELARWWRDNRYVPWELAPTVEFLAFACRVFWAGGVSVIRMGVAEEEGLARAVLAGPRHPGLGGMARGLALHGYIEEQIAAAGSARGTIRSLYVPRRFQGEFWGQKKALEPRYAAIGLERERVRWWDGDCFAVSFAAPN